MKKNILKSSFLLLTLISVSCKKQYTCQCVSTFEKPGYYPYTISSTKTIEKTKSLRRAKDICSYSEKHIGKYMEDEIKKPDETHTTSCAIK